MLEKPQISHPASFVTSTAVGFADREGNLSVVSSSAPMPVVQARPSAPAPMAGETRTSLLAGPFVPLPGAPIHLQLTGTWTGSVMVMRSIDNGSSRQPLTAGGRPWGQFSANVNEVVWEEGEAGATFYLDIKITSGSLNYRVSQ